MPTRETEEKLFGTQGTSGIKFEQYQALEVQRSGPGANLQALQGFSQLEATLPPFLMRNIRLMRYESPTPIQSHAVPLGLSQHDLMCCAQTGSGKTAAFLIPCLGRLDQASLGSEAPSGDAGHFAAPDPRELPGS